MSDLLTTIQAPLLGNSGYGDNIETILETINTNFTNIVTNEFLKGARGENLLVEEINLTTNSDLVRSFFQCLYGNSISVSEMEEFSRVNSSKLYMIYMEDENGEKTYVSSLPYTFLDPVFNPVIKPETASEAQVAAEAIDRSCVVLYQERDGEFNFNKLNSFPTLYFNINMIDENNDYGQFCWIINGNRTNLPAQGPRGQKGVNGRCFIVNINDPSTDEDGNVTIDGEINTIVNLKNYELSELDGQSAFIYVRGDEVTETVSDDTNTGAKVYFSTLIYDENNERLLVRIDNGYNISDIFSNNSFYEVLDGLTPESHGIIYMPADNEKQTHHILSTQINIEDNDSNGNKQLVITPGKISKDNDLTPLIENVDDPDKYELNIKYRKTNIDGDLNVQNNIKSDSLYTRNIIQPDQIKNGNEFVWDVHGKTMNPGYQSIGIDISRAGEKYTILHTYDHSISFYENISNSIEELKSEYYFISYCNWSCNYNEVDAKIMLTYNGVDDIEVKIELYTNEFKNGLVYPQKQIEFITNTNQVETIYVKSNIDLDGILTQKTIYIPIESHDVSTNPYSENIKEHYICLSDNISAREFEPEPSLNIDDTNFHKLKPNYHTYTLNANNYTIHDVYVGNEGGLKEIQNLHFAIDLTDLSHPIDIKLASQFLIDDITFFVTGNSDKFIEIENFRKYFDSTTVGIVDHRIIFNLSNLNFETDEDNSGDNSETETLSSRIKGGFIEARRSSKHLVIFPVYNNDVIIGYSAVIEIDSSKLYGSISMGVDDIINTNVNTNINTTIEDKNLVSQDQLVLYVGEQKTEIENNVLEKMPGLYVSKGELEAYNGVIESTYVTQGAAGSTYVNRDDFNTLQKNFTDLDDQVKGQFKIDVTTQIEKKTGAIIEKVTGLEDEVLTLTNTLTSEMDATKARVSSVEQNMPSIEGNTLTVGSSSITLFSGDYSDLINKPTIPSKMSQLTNDANLLTTTAYEADKNNLMAVITASVSRDDSSHYLGKFCSILMRGLNGNQEIPKEKMLVWGQSTDPCHVVKITAASDDELKNVSIILHIEKSETVEFQGETWNVEALQIKGQDDDFSWTSGSSLNSIMIWGDNLIGMHSFNYVVVLTQYQNEQVVKQKQLTGIYTITVNKLIVS